MGMSLSKEITNAYCLTTNLLPSNLLFLVLISPILASRHPPACLPFYILTINNINEHIFVQQTSFFICRQAGPESGHATASLNSEYFFITKEFFQ
jgi:hypothetical protein